MKYKFSSITALYIIATFTLSATEFTFTPEPHFSNIAVSLSKILPEQHTTHLPLDDEISVRAFNLYMDSLDSNHEFFILSDIEKFEKRLKSLDDELKVGDTSFAFDVFTLFNQRVAERASYITNILTSEFDFDLDESYSWNRKYSDWPKDQKEQDEIWRKIMKNKFLHATLKNEGEKKESKEEINEKIINKYKTYQKAIQEFTPMTILQKYLCAFTEAYDPHCSFMSPSASDEFKSRLALSIAGIGAMLSRKDGQMVIKEILPGGAASLDKREIRLVPGDQIIGIGQGDEDIVDIRKMPFGKAIRLIRGEIGTKVVIQVISKEDQTGNTIREVDLIRAKVQLKKRAARYEIIETPDRKNQFKQTAVITIDSFYGNIRSEAQESKDYLSVSHDVAKILLELKDKKIDGILIDLRNNSGGSLREAASLTGLFIESGPVVQILNDSHRTYIPDEDRSISYSGPLALLVSKYSASATEIFAAALQDYGRAIVVGDSKTLGKGSVQTIQPLGKDKKLGSVKVTTSLYFRINGSATQLKGVAADVIIPSSSESSKPDEQYLANALQWRMIYGLRYNLFCDLIDTVAELNKRSEARIQANEDFMKYSDIISKLNTIYEEETISLNIDNRRETRNKRTFLKDDLKDLTKKDEDESEDFVLNESLHILTDLIEIQPDVDVSEEAQAALPDLIKIDDIPASIRKEAVENIERLGSEDHLVRKQALEALIDLGNIAKPVLKQFINSDDPEIRLSVRTILKYYK